MCLFYCVYVCVCLSVPFVGHISPLRIYGCSQHLSWGGGGGVAWWKSTVRGRVLQKFYGYKHPFYEYAPFVN